MNWDFKIDGGVGKLCRPASGAAKGGGRLVGFPGGFFVSILFGLALAWGDERKTRTGRSGGAGGEVDGVAV